MATPNTPPPVQRRGKRSSAMLKAAGGNRWHMLAAAYQRRVGKRARRTSTSSYRGRSSSLIIMGTTICVTISAGEQSYPASTPQATNRRSRTTRMNSAGITYNALCGAHWHRAEDSARASRERKTRITRREASAVAYRMKKQPAKCSACRLGNGRGCCQKKKKECAA